VLAEAVIPIIMRAAAARGTIVVRFGMTAGPKLATVAVRTLVPVACSPAHIGRTGLSVV
jgi:hypothetical protein